MRAVESALARAHESGEWHLPAETIVDFEALLARPEVTPVRLGDADGVLHEFHFRSQLFGDQLSLEAFELVSGNEECAGFRFQLLGDPRSDPFELFGDLVQKVKRALAVRHLVEREGTLDLAGTTVRGRIERDGNGSGRIACVVIDGRPVDWTDFGTMLMAFEGWQFRIELVDPGDEA
ncbi:hypothetical protein PQR75_10490 [Paraburkholderia fungorum]|uniref:DUF7713 domain-containing protein n=1 Tax=Paraburkholderia fungorum TaxID=134537 RepID=UPI0038B86596